eukprot:TRINITY_DN49737_c0_g1_i1.p1 TRINITY_DN49737_c0_g1~~TRINITY_DN49737_c0_g1_i1.p1  ORF type:complete len:312 (-),score=91.81 TRINITY_DN49737_c0_g1_i1:345-1280(-)
MHKHQDLLAKLQEIKKIYPDLDTDSLKGVAVDELSKARTNFAKRTEMLESQMGKLTLENQVLSGRNMLLDENVQHLETALHAMSEDHRRKEEANLAQIAGLESTIEDLKHQLVAAEAGLVEERRDKLEQIESGAAAVRAKLEASKVVQARMMEGMEQVGKENEMLVALLHARDTEYEAEKERIAAMPEMHGRWVRVQSDEYKSDSEDEDQLVFEDARSSATTGSGVDQFGLTTSWRGYPQSAHPPAHSRAQTARPSPRRSTKSARPVRRQSPREAALEHIGYGGVSHNLKRPVTLHILKRDRVAASESMFM